MAEGKLIMEAMEELERKTENEMEIRKWL